MIEQQKDGKGEGQSELEGLLSGAGALNAETPLGREPLTYTMESLDRLRAKLRMQSAEASQRNPQTARGIEAKRQSVERVVLAYQMIAYPVLDVADARFGNNAGRDSLAHGPSSWKRATNELIADAIEHPGQNTEEFPNRGPITLSPAERAVLGKLAAARGLPFDPQRDEYDYRELAPRRQARMDETDRRLGWIGIDNAVDVADRKHRRSGPQSSHHPAHIDCNWPGPSDP